MYNGPKKERDEVLHDFKLGRLDVGTNKAILLPIALHAD
jgi:hypothetical protein